MKVYETQLMAYTPKKVKSLGMSKNGFPLVDGEPQQLDENNIYELDSKLYIYMGGDDWDLAIDGVNYSSTKRIIDFIENIH